MPQTWKVDATFRNGQRVRDSTERLRSGVREVENFKVGLAIEEPDVHPHAILARVSVPFSDAQKIARYELWKDYFYDPNTPQGDSPFTASYQEYEEQISGP